MSEREDFTNELANKIRELHRWTAPYGIIVGLSTGLTKKHRLITFGVARLLDACIRVYSSKYLVLESEGPMAQFGDSVKFSSEQELLDFIKTNYVFDDTRY